MRVQYCLACKMCIAACPYGTISMDTIGMPDVDADGGETLAQRSAARWPCAVTCAGPGAWKTARRLRLHGGLSGPRPGPGAGRRHRCGGPHPGQGRQARKCSAHKGTACDTCRIAQARYGLAAYCGFAGRTIFKNSY